MDLIYKFNNKIYLIYILYIMSIEINDDSLIEKPFCRFCFDDTNPEDLFVPCNCTGTARYVHKRCLQEWRSQDIHSLNYTRCQECLLQYEMTNDFSFRLSCWIKCCRLLSYSYLSVFVLMFTEFMFIHLLLNRFNLHTSIAENLGITIVSFNDELIMNFVILVIPLFIFILIHDIYIYYKYNLDTYFDNYAGIGFKKTIVILIICIFLVSYVFPIIGLICVSLIFQRIFKHMLVRHYNIYVTESSEIADLRDRNELEIVINNN